MILDDIISFFPNGKATQLIHWIQMDNYFYYRASLWRDQRFLISPPQLHKGTELLKYILGQINLDIVLKMSDIDIFNTVAQPLADINRNAYDSVFMNTYSKHMFVKGNPTIPEFVLNTSYSHIDRTYPFNTAYNSVWKSLRGVRFLYHDANELVGDFLNWKIEYTSNLPNYTVFSMDVTTLAMKWIKYAAMVRENKEQPNISTFLQTEEYSQFYDDFHRIWQLNLLQRILSSDHENNVLLDSQIPQYYGSISTLQRGGQELIHAKQLIQQGSMRPEDFMMIPWFRQGTLSFQQMLSRHIRSNQVPPIRQYRVLELLYLFPYLSIVVQLCKLYPNTLELNNLKLRVLPFLRDLQKQNLLASITSNSVRAIYTTKLSQFVQLLSN